MPQELGQIDTSVTLPRAVLAEAAASDALHKQVYQPETPPTPTETPPPVATVTPESKPETPPAPTTSVVEPDSWEHKYNSMRGRYQAEVPRLKDHVRSLTARVSELEGLLTVAEAKVTAPELRPASLLTDDERKDYGDEFLSVVGKRAQEELSPLVADLKAQIAGLTRQLGEVTNNTAQATRASLFADLDKNVKGWRELNVNDKFLDWLDLPDTYSGATRRTLLQQAFERNDSPRVTAFFQGFLAEEAALEPVDPEPNQNMGANPGKVPLADLAAPGRARTAAGTNTPAEKPIYTARDITKFYADLNSGKYRGRDDEKNRIEADIIAATREGRVKN